jgi:probable phosphoglycerate mutase
VSRSLPVVYLAGHAETAWSLNEQYIGSKDLPLIERGERNALRLKERLRGLVFAKVLTGSVTRVVKTCELAGFGAYSEVDGELEDWNYGLYEGRRTADILKESPNWDLFRDGCPGGETPRAVVGRADRVIGRLRNVPGNVLVFSSPCFFRVLAARWIAMEDLLVGRRLMLSPGSVSGLGYENSYAHPVIRFWNDVHHLGG